MTTPTPAKFRSAADPANIVIRLMVGTVFLSEGCQKFLFAAELGVGRFTKLGLPHPEWLAPLVGIAEIIGGAALLAGVRVRLAVLPLLVVILGAIGTTKWPMFMKQGFWITAHEGRADFCMLLGLLFLLIRGAGRYSWDNRRAGSVDAHG